MIQVDNEPVACTIPMRLPGGKPASGTYLVNMSLDLEAGLPWMLVAGPRASVNRMMLLSASRAISAVDWS